MGETVNDVVTADRATEEAVLDTVTTMIGEIIGEDDLADLGVSRDSMITEDLELESIEFVSLAEKLREHYGERVDFVDWIGGLELEQIILLTVGQLVDFVVECLR